MALGKIDPKKLWQGLKKYRYAALVLLLGLALLLLPGGKKTTQKSNAAASAAQTDYAAETERRLTQMLQQIAGAGAGQRDADAGDRGARGIPDGRAGKLGRGAELRVPENRHFVRGKLI